MRFARIRCNLTACTATSSPPARGRVLARCWIAWRPTGKILAIKGKISPRCSIRDVIAVAVVVVTVIMVFVIPSFKEVFSSFGATLRPPTLVVIAMSDFFVAYWFFVFACFIAAVVGMCCCVTIGAFVVVSTA